MREVHARPRLRNARGITIYTSNPKEITLAVDSSHRPSDAQLKKLQRDEDGRKAMAEYKAEVAAVSARTARLRALRVAREARRSATPSAGTTAPTKSAKPAKSAKARA
jgi:hypothetical protein